MTAEVRRGRGSVLKLAVFGSDDVKSGASSEASSRVGSPSPRSGSSAPVGAVGAVRRAMTPPAPSKTPKKSHQRTGQRGSLLLQSILGSDEGRASVLQSIPPHAKARALDQASSQVRRDSGSKSLGASPAHSPRTGEWVRPIDSDPIPGGIIYGRAAAGDDQLLVESISALDWARLVADK